MWPFTWPFMWPWFQVATCADGQRSVDQLWEQKYEAAQMLIRVPATCDQMVTCTLSLLGHVL